MKRAGLIALIILPAACAGLLGLRTSSTPKTFEHRAHVLKGINCVTCHAGITKAGDRGPLHLPDDASCVSCHEKPHDTRSCTGCHASKFTAHDLTQVRSFLKFSHETHVKRVNGNCVDCHRGIKTRGETLRPPMATCLSCHQHREQFADRDCNHCHVDLPTELSKPQSHLVHGADFLREHGVRAASAADLCATCHTESACAKCHGATVAALPSRLAFDKPMAAGMHRAGFLARHKEAAKVDQGMCSSCHTESSCQNCHDRRGVSARGDSARLSPHPSGWVGVGTQNQHGRAARLDPVACASCHSGSGEAMCVSCHRVGGVGGTVHPPGWSSRLSESRDMPCRLCHGVGL